MLQGQIEALPCGAGNSVGLHAELEGRDGPARVGGGAGEREATIPPALIEDVLGSPGYGQLQGGQPFPLQSGATSHHSPVPPGPASPQQLEKKFGKEWYREEKREKQQQVFGHQGDGNEGGFKISKPASAPQSRPALDRLRRGNRCLPGSLRFQKSSHSRQITDDGEGCLIPINSQSVINIWASSM